MGEVLPKDCKFREYVRCNALWASLKLLDLDFRSLDLLFELTPIFIVLGLLMCELLLELGLLIR